MNHHLSEAASLKARMICCFSFGEALLCGKAYSMSVPGDYLHSILQSVNDSGIFHIWHVEFIPQKPSPIAVFLHFKSRFQSGLKKPTIIQGMMKHGHGYVFTHTPSQPSSQRVHVPSFATLEKLPKIIKLKSILFRDTIMVKTSCEKAKRIIALNCWDLRTERNYWKSMKGWEGHHFANMIFYKHITYRILILCPSMRGTATLLPLEVSSIFFVTGFFFGGGT